MVSRLPPPVMDAGNRESILADKIDRVLAARLSPEQPLVEGAHRTARTSAG